jgi:hypothetical protein
MQVGYRLTGDDAMALASFHMDHPRAFLSAHRIYLMCAVIMLILGVSGIYLIGPDGSTSDRIRLITLFCFCVVFFALYFFRHRITARAIRKQFSDPEFVKRLGTQRLKVTPASFMLSSARATATTFWKGLDRIVVVENRAFFCPSNRMPFVVPGHAFHDEFDFMKFVETARSYHEASLGFEQEKGSNHSAM